MPGKSLAERIHALNRQASRRTRAGKRTPLAVAVLLGGGCALLGTAIGGVRSMLLLALAVLLAALLAALALHHRRECVRLTGAVEQRHALAVEALDGGILDWDIANAIDLVFLSPRARQLVGIASDADVFASDAWVVLASIHPEDRERRERGMREHLEGAAAMHDGEYRVARPASPT